jgi:hypothetical protein
MIRRQRRVRKGKCSRSVQTSPWFIGHSASSSRTTPVHFWIPYVCCWGRRKPRVTDSGPSAKTSCAGVWKNSILPDRSIYIKRGLLRFESLCMTILSFHHDIPRTSDQKNHPSVFGWGIELLIFRSNSDRDPIKDYPEIGSSACSNPTIEARHISMVGSARGNS